MIYAKGKIFYCDTEADVKDLPTDRSPDCVAKVIETSNIYRINSSGNWVLQANSGGSGGSSSREDIYISSAELDNEDNLILGFSTSQKEPIKVNLGSINQPEIFLLQSELEKNKIEPATEGFIEGLFN